MGPGQWILHGRRRFPGPEGLDIPTEMGEDWTSCLAKSCGMEQVSKGKNLRGLALSKFFLGGHRGHA